jgi:hypothetical protein
MESVDTHERGMHILESVAKDMRREATGEAIYIDVVKEWFRYEVYFFAYTIDFRLQRSEI